MALDDDIALMARVPLFASLGDEPVRLLAFSAETRFLRAGDVLFKEGQAADSGYVVAAGRVTLESEGEIGEFIAGPAASSARSPSSSRPCGRRPPRPATRRRCCASRARSSAAS